jgi:hypothetical protein
MKLNRIIKVNIYSLLNIFSAATNYTEKTTSDCFPACYMINEINTTNYQYQILKPDIGLIGFGVVDGSWFSPYTHFYKYTLSSYIIN